MTELRYVGKNARGILRSKALSLPVEKGQVYDIPNDNVDSVLASGEWERVSAKVVNKPKKEEKKVVVEENVFDDEEENIDY